MAPKCCLLIGWSQSALSYKYHCKYIIIIQFIDNKAIVRNLCVNLLVSKKVLVVRSDSKIWTLHKVYQGPGLYEWALRIWNPSSSLTFWYCGPAVCYLQKLLLNLPFTLKQIPKCQQIKVLMFSSDFWRRFMNKNFWEIWEEDFCVIACYLWFIAGVYLVKIIWLNHRYIIEVDTSSAT